MSKYLLYGLVIALGLSLAGNAAMGLWVRAVNAEKKVLAQSIKNCDTANEAQDTVNKFINDQLAICIGEGDKVEKAHAQEKVEQNKRIKLLAFKYANERKLRDAIYDKDAKCNAWGSIPVCDGISQRLRADSD